MELGRTTKKIRVSDEKVRANRNNSLKSTGPKTRKGKAVVKWNAMKHGLLSKEVIIDAGEGIEDENEFEQLFNALRIELCPAGILEEMLVEKIAICYWRLRRVVKFEVGELRKRLDNATMDIIFKRADDFKFDRTMAEAGGNKDKLRKTIFGIKCLLAALDDIKFGIEESGELSDYSTQELCRHFETEKGSFGYTLMLFNHMATKGQSLAISDPEKYGDTPDREKLKKAMIKIINNEKKQLKEISAHLNKIENEDINAQKKALYLPEKEAIDKMLRYETAIERQLYRAIHELIRLQSARMGGNPTIPLAIDVNVSNQA